MLGNASYSQSSASSTGNSQSDRAELISLMERGVQEITESRLIIEQYKIQAAAYEEAIAKAEKLDDANQAQIILMKAELGKVREALTDKQTALDAKQKEVDAYKAALAKEINKKNFFKKLTKFSTAAAVIAIGLLVLRP